MWWFYALISAFFATLKAVCQNRGNERALKLRNGYWDHYYVDRGLGNCIAKRNDQGIPQQILKEKSYI